MAEFSVMDAYLEEMGSHDRLSAEQEHALALEIIARRRACWYAMLDAFVLPHVLDVVQDAIDAPLLKSLMTAHRWIMKMPDSENAQQTWETARAASADALTDAGKDPAPVARGLEAREQGTADIRLAARSFQQCRDRFVCANLRLVASMASRYGKYHLPLADRVQEGNLGLLHAVNRFDPDRGVRFSTYAVWWIRHHIMRALTNSGRLVRVPNHLQVLFTRTRKVHKILLDELGRDPTEKEIADEMGIDVEKLKKVRALMDVRVTTIDVNVSSDRPRRLHELLIEHNEVDVGEFLDDHRDMTVARLAIRDLRPRLRKIVSHRYGIDQAEPMTLQMLADEYGVSRERVRQLEKRALESIRGAVEKSSSSSISMSPRDTPWDSR